MTSTHIRPNKKLYSYILISYLVIVFNEFTFVKITFIKESKYHNLHDNLTID